MHKEGTCNECKVEPGSTSALGGSPDSSEQTGVVTTYHKPTSGCKKSSHSCVGNGTKYAEDLRLGTQRIHHALHTLPYQLRFLHERRPKFTWTMSHAGTASNSGARAGHAPPATCS
eukprot:4724996-Amphidinium_carterae.1